MKVRPEGRNDKLLFLPLVVWEVGDIMAGISTSIELTDRVSGSLNRITASLYNTTSAFQGVDRASETAFDTGAVSAMTQELYGYSERIQQLESDLVDSNRRLAEMEEKTQKAAQSADMLRGAFNVVKGVIAGLGVQKIIQTSDALVQAKSRIGLMTDNLEETQALMDLIYHSAQNSRGSFSEMASVVARFGNNAKDAFSSNDEVVAFAELVQKQMVIAGSTTTESANAILQLSQALASGVLRGDELRSIFEQAPNLIQSIADYLDVPISQIREMASEGELSADVVKAAIFASADDINAKFSEMPMTWGQVWQSMQNTALMKFQPVLQRINDIANSDSFKTFANGAIEAMAVLANVLLNIFEFIATVSSFIADNWSIISPIVYGVVTALALYAAYLGIVKAAEIIGAAVKIAMCVASYAHAAATGTEATATAAATAAQYGLNTALLACPLTWIILLIVALIAVIYAVCSAIAKMTGVANSGFGVITGGVNVVIQFFKNLGLSVANIALGIGNAIAALGSNMMNAFHNAIMSVQSWFYGLLADALYVVEGICKALNKLPFVEFDYSGITNKADEYANKAAEAANNKADYTSISDAFSEGMSTFDTFQDGWVSDAFDSGAAWGDGLVDKVGGLFDTSSIDSAYTDTGAGSLLDSVNSIGSDTSEIADGVNISNENLKYLRDIAEQEAVNQFTTAEIKVDMQNNNNINNNIDIDGIIEQLTTGVEEAMIVAAEGVH